MGCVQGKQGVQGKDWEGRACPAHLQQPHREYREEGRRREEGREEGRRRGEGGEEGRRRGGDGEEGRRREARSRGERGETDTDNSGKHANNNNRQPEHKSARVDMAVSAPHLWVQPSSPQLVHRPSSPHLGPQPSTPRLAALRREGGGRSPYGSTSSLQSCLKPPQVTDNTHYLLPLSCLTFQQKH